MPVCAFALAIIFVCAAPQAAGTNEAFITKLFTEHRSTGTLVIKSQRSDRVWLHDQVRAKRRYIRASTFKIPNTLIALDVGVAHSADQVFKWDGVIRWLGEWNQDLTLGQAFRVSSVSVFQRLAREIGAKRMKAGLAELGYGNQQIGKTVDRFWLSGPLEISAAEQFEFMKRISEGKLPFSTEHLAVLKDVMVERKGDGWTLFGKTGWTNTPDPDIGWYVGWLETADDRFFFALNMDMTRKAQRAVRRKITNLPVH